jgi:hypothetical protein
MIKNINGYGKYLTVVGGTPSTYIHNNYNSGNQGVGNMRYNTSTQNTEVFDGNNWVILNMSTPSIGLNSDAESLLDWAREKRNEELEREHLAQTNPAIKDLLEQIKEKEDQIKMVQTLLKKEVSVESN